MLAAWRLCAGCSRLASLDLLSPPCAVGVTVAPASWFGELNAEDRPYLAHGGRSHMLDTVIIVCELGHCLPKLMFRNWIFLSSQF